MEGCGVTGIRCELCGQFIAYMDFEKGRAHMVQDIEMTDIYGSIREDEYVCHISCEKTQGQTQ